MSPIPYADPSPSFVARNRIVIWRLVLLGLALLAATGTPAWSGHMLAVILRVAGIVFVSAAALGRLWCALYISGRKSSELVMEGPYSVCRHPLYLFNLSGFIGLALLSESLLATGITVLAFAVLYPGVLASEERLLRRRFAEFEAYRRSTPALFPNVRLYRSPERWTVEVNAFMRNLRDSIWFPLMAIAVELIDVAHASSWVRGWFTLY